MLHGDTAISSIGMDTYGSRSLPVGGVALWYAAEKVIDKAREIAAHELEVSPTTSSSRTARSRSRARPTRSGRSRASRSRPGRRHNLPDGMEPGLEATAVYDPPNFSWPGGAHAAVVEVDTETGDARLIRYVAVDDVGTVVNPIIVDGQVHGGITQGIATALYEEGVYDEDGNLQTANLVTYLVPSAAELPSFELERTESRSPTNPLGVKGVGETGTIAAAPAVISAVDRRGVASRREGHPDAGHARACLARDRGGEGVIPARFDYDVAESVEHAIELLAAGGGETKLLAGGQSLIPALKLRIVRPAKLVDLGRLADLAYVRDGGTHVAIGALTRHAAVASDPLLAEHCPIVSYTAAQIGDPQVRHRGTIGGTLSHGDPASDMPAVMLALGAELVARGRAASG